MRGVLHYNTGEVNVVEMNDSYCTGKEMYLDGKPNIMLATENYACKYLLTKNITGVSFINPT